jgi:hypothetical protein
MKQRELPSGVRRKDVELAAQGLLTQALLGYRFFTGQLNGINIEANIFLQVGVGDEGQFMLHCGKAVR